jgi:hypothetical protein
MRVGIHQPNYAPWLGYFAKIAAVDVFVFLDDVQMPGGQSYVYRSQILSHAGTQWLSAPTRYPFGALISDVTLADSGWAERHLKTLRMVYGRCPHFAEIFHLIEPLYTSAGHGLAAFNQNLIARICSYLGLTPVFEQSHNLTVRGTSDQRLIEIVRTLGGTTYISGSGGQNYQDPDHFRRAGVNLAVRTYRPIPYSQGKRSFVGGLSALDALFNIGPDTRKLLRYDDVT